jgi:hypothetical protein
VDNALSDVGGLICVLLCVVDPQLSVSQARIIVPLEGISQLLVVEETKSFHIGLGQLPVSHAECNGVDGFVKIFYVAREPLNIGTLSAGKLACYNTTTYP